MDIDNEGGIDGKTDTSEPVTYCLQALLAIEVLLNPSSDTQMFVNELLMVQRLKVIFSPFYSYIMDSLILNNYIKNIDKKYINKKERERHLPGYCQFVDYDEKR